MGLLASMLGNGMEAVGDTLSKGYLLNMRNAHEKELEDARALRERSLAEFNAKKQFELEDVKHGRTLSASYDPDTGRQLTYGEADEYDPSSLIGAEEAKDRFSINKDYLINGRPATNAQLMDNAEANRNLGLIQSAARDRAASAVEEAKDPNLTDEQRAAILAKGEYTDDEQEVADSWQADAGDVTDLKKETATAKAEVEREKLLAKLDAQKEIMESKLANAKELNDAKLEVYKTVAQLKILNKNDPSTVKEMTKGQAATVAASLLKRRRDNGGELDADEQLLLDATLGKATGKKAAASVGDVFKGDGRQMPIPQKGKGLITTANASTTPKAKGGYTYRNGKLVAN